jgi:cellulose synthase (UDP-forming)
LDTLFTERLVKSSDTSRAAFPGLKGVNYSKGMEWQAKLNVFTKEELEADVAEIKGMHINTIKRYGPNIYDRNVLETARKNGLQVHYGFWIPENVDFKKDVEILSELRETILKTIDDLKDSEEINTWNLGNAVLQKLENRYAQPDLLYQQQACLLWLKDTVLKIKKADPTRALTIDVNASNEMAFVVKRIRNLIPEIDAFGLVIGNQVPAIETFNALPAPYFISYVIPKNQSLVPTQNAVFLSNWQDEKWTNKVSFDGVKDFSGKYKSKTFTLPVKILKPAAGTFADTELAYHAIVKKNGRWKLAAASEENLRYEWKLVKTDQYANPLTVTDVGAGPQLMLKIPKNADFYQLYLYAIQGDSVKAVIRSTLNTPLAPLANSVVGY